MPAQVTVVKRPRRSLFAVPRALPDWLRSLWAALFRTTLRAQASARLSADDFQSMNVTLFPTLVMDEGGEHRCVGCELCVRVCPTRCLSIAIEGGEAGGGIGEGAGARRLTRFELASGACIGCGECAEACPENALAMTASMSRVELAPLLGGAGNLELYAAPLQRKA